MTVAAFVSATSVDEAVEALVGGARPVAGGTDLVVGARQGKAPLPESIVAIDRIAELRGITEMDGALRLGALVTHEEIAANLLVRERFTALADASAIVGSHATRAQGTIGGNLMNASPAMETGGPLMCLGATVMLQSPRGSRWVAVDDLFTGPGGTVAQPDELLVAVDVPAPGRRHRQLLRAPRVPSADGDRGRRGHGGGDARRRADQRATGGDHRARSDDPPRAGGRGRPRGLRRWSGRGCGGCRGGGPGERPDLGCPRLGGVPARDGRGDGQARDRWRDRPRSWRSRLHPGELSGDRHEGCRKR